MNPRTKDETAESAKSAEHTILCVLRVLGGSFFVVMISVLSSAARSSELHSTAQWRGAQ
jgi:hypothetical protein